MLPLTRLKFSNYLLWRIKKIYNFFHLTMNFNSFKISIVTIEIRKITTRYIQQLIGKYCIKIVNLFPDH